MISGNKYIYSVVYCIILLHKKDEAVLFYAREPLRLKRDACLFIKRCLSVSNPTGIAFFNYACRSLEIPVYRL